MTATTDATATRPRTSTLDPPTLRRLAATEYGRFASMLRRLTPEDWVRPTECPGWDVRAMAGHCLGMAEMAASIRDGMRQQRLAGKRGGVMIDALTALQVEEHADLTTRQLIEEFEKIGPKAARARHRTPRIIGNRRMPGDQSVGGSLEAWTLGFLMDTILTRDPWMHRMDITNATGTAPELSADHDGVLVADVVTEWSARHGEACRLKLTGPAGGHWTFGVGGPILELDAVDFCRKVSGRGQTSGLFATQVPF